MLRLRSLPTHDGLLQGCKAILALCLERLTSGAEATLLALSGFWDLISCAELPILSSRVVRVARNPEPMSGSWFSSLGTLMQQGKVRVVHGSSLKRQTRLAKTDVSAPFLYITKLRVFLSENNQKKVPMCLTCLPSSLRSIIGGKSRPKIGSVFYPVAQRFQRFHPTISNPFRNRSVH